MTIKEKCTVEKIRRNHPAFQNVMRQFCLLATSRVRSRIQSGFTTLFFFLKKVSKTFELLTGTDAIFNFDFYLLHRGRPRLHHQRGSIFAPDSVVDPDSGGFLDPYPDPDSQSGSESGSESGSKNDSEK